MNSIFPTKKLENTQFSDLKPELKFAFFSVDGHGFPVAHQLQTEGAEVHIGFIEDFKDIGMKREESPEERKRRHEMFDGMFDNRHTADELLKMLDEVPYRDRQDWFVVCDFNFLWPMADKIKKLGGYRGLLPTKEDASFEEDRQKAKEFFKKNYPIFTDQQTYEFKTVDDAIEAMEDIDVPLVAKGFDDAAPTIVPDDNEVEDNHEEIIDVLLQNREVYEKKGFLLEEKIPDIVEFTPDATWFDGELLSVTIDLEAKGLGSGDSGRQTGCSLDTVFWLNDPSKVYDAFLKPLAKIMNRPGELTLGDASVLYSPSRDAFFPGEFCFNRWGFNAIFTQMAAIGSATEYFRRLVNKEPIYQRTGKQFGASLRIFNLTPDSDNAGLTKGGGLVRFEDDLDIWPWDVKVDEDGLYRAVGHDKNLAVVSGAGDTLTDAIDQVYETEVDFKFTGKYIRAKHDFVSEDYATAILRRFRILNHFVFEVPDINHMNRRDPELKAVLPYTQEKTEDNRNRMTL